MANMNHLWGERHTPPCPASHDKTNEVRRAISGDCDVEACVGHIARPVAYVLGVGSLGRVRCEYDRPHQRHHPRLDRQGRLLAFRDRLDLSAGPPVLLRGHDRKRRPSTHRTCAGSGDSGCQSWGADRVSVAALNGPQLAMCDVTPDRVWGHAEDRRRFLHCVDRLLFRHHVF